MLVLAMDTSTPAVSVALVEQSEPAHEMREMPDGLGAGTHTVTGMSSRRVVAEAREVATNRHGELLTPLIAQTLTDAALVPHDLSAVVVGLGPGPFTGLRVGIMTAASMADALDVPIYGQCSLDGFLDPWGAAEFSFATVIDARRKQVYWASFAAPGVPAGGPDIGPPAGVAEELAAAGVTHVMGAGASAYPAEFARFTVVDEPYPKPAELVRCVTTRLVNRAPSDPLTPLYLRRPDAVPPGRPKQVTPV